MFKTSSVVHFCYEKNKEKEIIMQKELSIKSFSRSFIFFSRSFSFFCETIFSAKKKESLFIRLNAKQERVVTKERRAWDQSQLFSSFPFLQIIQWSAGQVHINIRNSHHFSLHSQLPKVQWQFWILPQFVFLAPI